MMTEQNGGADASLDGEAYEHLMPLEMGASEMPAETPVEQPHQETTQAQAAPEAQAEAQVAERPPVEQQAQKEDAHRVPLRELLDERDRRQQQVRENEALRRQLQEFQARQQQQQQRPEFWEQPENNIDYRIQQALQPYAQQLIAQRETFARALAETQHGSDKVSAAFKDMSDRINSGDPSARFDYQRIMSEPNPYSALVDLHRQRQTIAEIGSDPAAYRARALDEALKDPAFLARALEAAKSQAGASPSVVTYAAPKSKGVPSISNIGAAGSISNGALPDLSDQELYDKYMP